MKHFNVVITFFSVLPLGLVAACQSSNAPATTDAVAAAPTTAETLSLPETIPAEATQLTGAEIAVAFSNRHEDYWAIDMPGITASGEWAADTMFANWTNSNSGNSGYVAGTWRVDGDQRCIDFTEGPAGTTECTTIYQHGDGYLSVNPDGSLHGYHETAPL